MRTVEIQISDRYRRQHPWVVTAVNGFLSAYFIEQPGFRVLRHCEGLESGMPVWRCEVPATMKMSALLHRLQADLPPFRWSSTSGEGVPRTWSSYVIDLPLDD
ncbi:MAG: hypothetical protein NNA25_07650 [Nitrospira sp.]|nr:hypothetical protein [Nitrospira sp.]